MTIFPDTFTADPVVVHAHPDMHTVYGIEIRLREGVSYDEIVAAVAELPSSHRRMRNDVVAYLSEDLGLCDRVADRNIHTAFNMGQT